MRPEKGRRRTGDRTAAWMRLQQASEQEKYCVSGQETEHEKYWRRVLGDDAFRADLPIVTERFELVYPTSGPTPPVD